ncbi:MAG: hypothetical protein BGO98_43495 [Myxococcales bacterium 68-20]|nr:MAG: hypothetical protein BGO98_43495 [Myxococcales bacterium 68-20]
MDVTRGAPSFVRAIQRATTKSATTGATRPPTACDVARTSDDGRELATTLWRAPFPVRTSREATQARRRRPRLASRDVVREDQPRRNGAADACVPSACAAPSPP